MLEKVRYVDYSNCSDVEAFTDGYSYDDYSCLYLLSVAGRDSSVKAITSALVTGGRVEILADPVVEAWAPYGERYRILSTKLPDAVLHQIVLAAGFFKSQDARQRLLYVDEQDPAGVVYEAVSRGFPVPMIPDWSEWLYDRLRQEGYLDELRGTRRVLRLRVSEESLDALISEGVRSGEISF